jgi:hypothetical protein
MHPISKHSFHSYRHFVLIGFLGVSGWLRAATYTVEFDIVADTTDEDVSVQVGVTADGPLSVDIAVAGSATLYSDFTYSPDHLDFIGAGTQQITISTIDDGNYEDTETVQLTLTNVSTALPHTAVFGANRDYTLDLDDNDLAPSISFNGATSNGDEGATGYLPLILSPAIASGLPTSVTYTVTGGGTATGGGADYNGLGVTGTGTIPAGQTSGSISFNVLSDGLDESPETIIVTIANPVNAQPTIAISEQTFTINDMDSPPSVSFQASSSQNDEDAGTVDVVVALSAPSGQVVPVQYTVGGTADNPDDHDLGGGTVTFSIGATSRNIQINLVDDLLDETNETIDIALVNPIPKATLGTNTSHEFQIIDNDPLPTVEFNITNSNGFENADPTIQVDLLAASGRTVSVVYAVSGGDAVSGSDYQALGGTLVFAPGETMKTFPLNVYEDGIDEDPDTVLIELQNPPTNATLNALKSVYTYRIDDSDDPPDINFQLSASSNSEAATSPSIQVDLSGESGKNVSAGYRVSGGTATGGGVDYTLATGTVNIPAGATTTAISFSVVNDDTDEPDNETVDIELYSPVNATLGITDTHTYTIQDNDSPPILQFALAQSTGYEYDTAPVFALTLEDTSARDVQVVYSVTGGTATPGGVDFTLATDTLTILAGITSSSISAAVNDDALDEFDETIMVELSLATNARLLGGISEHEYTIRDDDDPPTVDFTSTVSSELEGFSPIQPVIALDGPSGKAISVNYLMLGGTATRWADYALADDVADFPEGETEYTINLPIEDEAAYENDETVRIVLRTIYPDPLKVDIGTDSVFVHTIQNDDPIPSLQFWQRTEEQSETISPANLTVTMTGSDSEVDASVDYRVRLEGTTADTLTDFSLPAGTATISAGDRDVNIAMLVQNDAVYEPDELVQVVLTNPVGATMGDRDTLVYTIQNDDPVPQVEFSFNGSSGDESDTDVEIYVDLNLASQLPVTVDYLAQDSSAIAGVDYNLPGGTLTFPPGTLSDTISVTVADNNLDQSNRLFRVRLTNVSGATIGGRSTHDYTIVDDDDSPIDFTVGLVVAAGDTVVTDYWNSTNDNLQITVPVDTSSDLQSGDIQLRAKVSNGAYQNLDLAYDIQAGDLGQDKALSIAAAVLEGLTGFDDDSTLTIGARITDRWGNSTDGTPSSNIILIDRIPPASDSTGAVAVTGGTAAPGYWNAVNSGITAVVPLDDQDESLDGGSVQLQGEVDGIFEDLGASSAITPVNRGAGSIALGVSATEVSTTGVEELTDFSDGYVLTFRSLVTDVAGNGTTYNISANSFVIDETVPTASVSYTDTLASQGDTVTITLTLDEEAATNPAPAITIAYSLNTFSGQSMVAVRDCVWTYDTIIPASQLNDGSATVTITAKDLAGNALTTGNTTNRTQLVVDNTPPGYVLSYTDSLVKSGDAFTITATVAELIQPIPTISIDYVGTGADVTDTTMNRGASDSIWTYLATTPTGNNGFATVTISALDIAGNTVTPISGSTNTLKVDNIAPTLALTAPVDNDFVSSTAVSYTLAENLASGQIVWTWENNAGVIDENTPHAQSLTGSELRIGSFSGLLTNAPALVQAAEYTVELIGFDRAGNADTVEVATVTYDTLAPGTIDVIIQDGPAADIDSTRSTDTLTVNYSGFNEPTSGIVLYEYALGSSVGASDIVDWTGAGTDTLVTVSGLQLDYKDSYYFMARATDGAGNQSDSVVSDGIRIVDKPRLTIHAVQNIVFADYLQVLVNDTLGMADSIRVLIDSTRVSVSAIDTYSYVGTHKFTQTGTHSLQVTGYSGWGDTLRTAGLSMALAKTWNTWNVTSADGRLRVAGAPGAVNEDRQLLLVGSELLGLPLRAGQVYRLADGQMPFTKPVKVSMRQVENSATIEQAQAIYLLGSNGHWEELPSVYEQGSVSAWTNRSGTFRLGPRTIIVPFSTALHQNYPNPFNPVTTIVFDIGLQDGPSQNATVIIYNLLGQQVKTLFDGPALAGQYTLSWQGVDELGSRVATGIYFIRLLTDQGTQKTRKMLLIR